VFQQDNTTIKERLTHQKEDPLSQSFNHLLPFFILFFLKKGESSAIIQSYTSFVQKESGIKLETS
jgi:hypothetical protein